METTQRRMRSILWLPNHIFNLYVKSVCQACSYIQYAQGRSKRKKEENNKKVLNVIPYIAQKIFPRFQFIQFLLMLLLFRFTFKVLHRKLSFRLSLCCVYLFTSSSTCFVKAIALNSEIYVLWFIDFFLTFPSSFHLFPSNADIICVSFEARHRRICARAIVCVCTKRDRTEIKVQKIKREIMFPSRQ